jgi:ADP-ribose pyrophosphatase
MHISPWVELIAREVEFSPGQTELYHAVKQQDYLAIVALTPSGHFPIVRQYRPALESFTWELPAGLAEPQKISPKAAGENYMRKPAIPRARSTRWVWRLPAVDG